MTASASRSTSGATALIRLRGRAVARVALLAASLVLCAALGQSTMQLATAAVPTGAGPYTMFGDTAPAVAGWTDPDGVELGVKFRTDVDGWITGVRFYKGPGNDGPHIGSLWTASGELLASGTFSAETDTGWQQLTFDQRVPVQSGTTYVASYFAPSGHYPGDGYYFTDPPAREGPVRPLASGVDGPNGVFSYGSTSSFPTDTFKDANYWVDVVFLAAIPAEDDPAQPVDPTEPIDAPAEPAPSLDPAVPTDPSDPVVSAPSLDPIGSSDPVVSAPSPDQTDASDPVVSAPSPIPTDPAVPTDPSDPVATEPSPIPTDPAIPTDPSDPVATAPTASPVPRPSTSGPAPERPAQLALLADPTPAKPAPATSDDDEIGIAAAPGTPTRLAGHQDPTIPTVRVALLTAALLAGAAGFGGWRWRTARGRRLGGTADRAEA